MKIEPLNWDSEFFKFKIGACYFTKPDLVPLQELDDYHLVYLFDESNQMKFDEWIFQNHSIQFSSTKCTYHWKVEPKEFKPNTVQTNLEISNYSDEPLEKLRKKPVENAPRRKYFRPASADLGSRRFIAVMAYTAIDMISRPRKITMRSRADAMNIMPTVDSRSRP